MTSTRHEPATLDEMAATIRTHRAAGVRLIGAGTKPALVGHAPDPSLQTARIGEILLSSRRLTGIVEYEAAEFTITARAGTPIRALDDALAENGQSLPFDPPFAGATLGGAIAAGLAGPGRVRFGGVRDFVLATTWVDGHGRVLRSGAKVVKNAAGFDLPKLLVGSLGRLGALAEVTLKVLPRPRVQQSARFCFGNFTSAYEGLVRLLQSPLELDGLEMVEDATLLVRLGSPSHASSAPRLARLGRVLGIPPDSIAADDEGATWRAMAACRDLQPEGCETGALIKVALSPRRIPELEAILRSASWARRYSAGGAVAWIAVPAAHYDRARDDASLEALDRHLASLALPALVVRGAHLGEARRRDPRLGHRPGDNLLARIKRVLDPDGVLPPLDCSPTA